jgi:very-short-patch-repair endonuclease
MPHSAESKRQRQRPKQLRPTITRAETLLWHYLQADRLDGLGFRRQVPIRNYIADLVCLSARIVIERDGESHDLDERQKADQHRDLFLISQGFEVLRFTDEQVMSDLEGVVEIIRQTTASRVRGSLPAPPLPHKGGRSMDAGADVLRDASAVRG